MANNVFSPFTLADPAVSVNGVKEATIFNLVSPNTVEKSYMFEATQFILEMNKEMDSAKSAFYISITESNGNRKIVHESFADFVGKIKTIIHKFLEFIKNLFNKFITKLNGIVKSEKYLEKHRNEFSKFTSDDEFDFEGFMFTIDEVPLNSKIFKDFESDVKNLRSSLDSIVDNDKTSIMKAADDAYESLMSNMDNYFWRFRAEVIGKDGDIESSDYPDELFMVFRNGDSTKSSITATSLYINTALNRVVSFDKTTKAVERDKKNLEREYSSLEKAVEKFSKTKFDDATKNYKATLNYGDDPATATTKEISQEAKAKIDMFISKKAEQIQGCANIHTMAFAAKLDALKDEYRQNKAVLYKALSKIQKVLPKKEDIDLSSNNYEPDTIIPINIVHDDNGSCDCPNHDDTIDGSSIEDILGMNDDDSNILNNMIESTTIPISYFDMNNFTKLKDTLKSDDALDQMMDALDGDVDKIFKAVKTESAYLIESCDGDPSDTIISIIESNLEDAKNLAIDAYTNKMSKVFDTKELDKEIKLFSSNAEKYSVTDNEQLRCNVCKEFAMIARARKANVEFYKNKSVNEDYSYANMYNSFDIENALGNHQCISILAECLLFSDKKNTPASIIESLNMINEGKIAQGAKTIFEKLKTFLNTIWQKFSEKAMKLFAADKTYLNKYKDTILKTKPQDGLKYEMPDHTAGIAAIQSSSIPVLRYNDQAKAELDKGLISYLNGIVPNLNLKEDSDYNSALKNMFTSGTTEGGTKEYLATQLNWTDIYNYCMNYQTMVNEIEKAKTIILQSHNEAERIINELEKEEDKNKPAEGAANEAYSMIFGKYITEADADKVQIKAPETNNNPTASTGKPTTNTGNPENTLSKNTNTVTGNEKPENSDAAKQKADQDKDLARKAIGQEIEKARDHCKVYFDAVNAIIAAKMTAIETIRKNYMAIIYDHVNRALSKKDGGQTQAQSATNYNNNQEQNKGPLNDNEKKQLSDLNDKLKNNTITDEEKATLTNLLDRNNTK